LNRGEADKRSNRVKETVAVLAPMAAADYAAFLASAIPGYAADKVAAGQWSEEESLELSRQNYEQLLPQGLGTPGHHLYCVLDERGQPVGTLWLVAKEQAGLRIAYIYDIEIRPDRRRRGHATRALRAAESEARRLGLAGIGLHVFGHNLGARALYESLGYRATNINMFKPL
jgi:ribosomal protein S18 acetylase RimI-like enzyme